MILVTGSNGQLGNELKLILGNKAVYTDSSELDITDLSAVLSFCNEHKISKIVNCAAYTAVDKAESEIELAEKVNVLGPKNLAQTGLPLFHISTDYVFDGTSCKPYIENDLPNPTSVYGKTKLEGEKAVMETATTAVIFRTSWLYSAFGNNFVKTMRRLGGERESLNVVFDQIGSPTNAKDLATAIVKVVNEVKLGTKEIYHFSNEGVCSWYDFAIKIMELSKLDCKVFPIESKDYPTPAKRPFYSVLNKNKIKTDFNVNINHWEKSLRDCIMNLEK